MKVINVLNESLKLEDIKNKIIIITKAQLNQVFDIKKDKEIINGLKYIDSNKIETYDDKYLLTFNFLTEENKRTNLEKIGIYSDFKTFAVFVTNNKDILVGELENLAQADLDYAGILLSLMANATDNDYIKLESLENELNDFDEKLSVERDLEKYSKKIMYYKKYLIKLKHHYEQINYIIDFFAGHSELLTLQEEKDKLYMLTRRIPKLVKEVVSFIDTLSQTRENYQAQIQIKQSNLMKIFTIITVVFTPLQFIVGWYGMNLIMPEFGFRYSYPIVITLCVITIVTLIVIFKKKNWFK